LVGAISFTERSDGYILGAIDMYESCYSGGGYSSEDVFSVSFTAYKSSHGRFTYRDYEYEGDAHHTVFHETIVRGTTSDTAASGSWSYSYGDSIDGYVIMSCQGDGSWTASRVSR
jgi:hypothetical protein